MRPRTLLAALGAAIVLAAGYAVPAQAQNISLNGAVQFNDDHAFTKALVRFEELVKKYYGKPIDFVLHKNSSLGLEKQYFEYMAQGKAVDYGIVSPAHMSTFSKAAPFIDAPFLFRDLDHWNKVLDADMLAPVADEVAKKADVMLIGYAGGGVRNIFINKPMGSLADIKGLKVRVQGAPIWSRTFAATGMSPTVIAYNEVYNAIQNNVIGAGENEAAGVESMKFYEVAPNLAMTAARHHHPADLLLGQDLQGAAPRPAAGDPQGRQGSRRLWPPGGVLGGRAEARGAREGRQAEAHSLQGSRRDGEAGGSRHGRLRQGDRRGRHLHQDRRHQVDLRTTGLGGVLRQARDELNGCGRGVVQAPGLRGRETCGGNGTRGERVEPRAFHV